MKFALPAVVACGLSGCQFIAIDPQGPVAESETQILGNALAIMLAIGAPVIVATFAFAWHFRGSNDHALHLPDWHYSGKIELVVWAIPTLAIFFLGALAVVGSQRLDPRAALPSDQPPLEVDVVALDWKWLFIYPAEGVASVQELALPVGRPVHFRLTSGGVMNSFFIPNLGSQIYAMGGMETQLWLQARNEGAWLGLSAQLSGLGFTDMHFRARTLSPDGFSSWVAQARAATDKLDRAAYGDLLKPALSDVKHYGGVDAGLFDAIVAREAPNPENAASCAPAKSAKQSRFEHSRFEHSRFEGA